jgi:hypothetical protein
MCRLKRIAEQARSFGPIRAYPYGMRNLKGESVYSTFYIPHQATHAPRFNVARGAAAGLALLCAGVLGYLSIDVFKDVRLVSETFPALPSDFAMDMDVSILFSPMMLHADDLGNDFLRWIKYPPLTLPNAPLPSGNPIEDQILKAQKDQGLLRPGGAAPLGQFMLLNQESLEAVGRAIYLSQENSSAAEAFERGKGGSLAHPNFAHASAVQQAREIFGTVYGQEALREAAKSKR